ncbi:ATP-binding protein [Paractinoplanes rhizophilus]|jgi:anti-anti-sigma regulatory factor|uniref:ATP-binding protein n=1 Tax=Paractinoplanes rhizophilus TaxID=1416877 RepID=A0ABW2HIV4_9ACTN|nr:ATP-binding protein [Actinoplanes sp.]
MAGPLAWTVDLDDGLAVVVVRGTLVLGKAEQLRVALLKCLAEQPDALLVDLAALEVADDTALSLFTAVSQQAENWPGTPLLLCAPSPPVAELLERGRHGNVPVYAGVAQARRAVAEGRAAVPSVTDELLPIAGAVRHARNLVTEACLAWDLPELVGSASLVVSELVSNAVEHAGTMMTVRVTRRGRYVHIAVRDGSPREPVAGTPGSLSDRGRGLVLVNTVAEHWGSLPTRDGKVVWATLAAP